jgi:hypothetical protein
VEAANVVYHDELLLFEAANAAINFRRKGCIAFCPFKISRLTLIIVVARIVEITIRFATIYPGRINNPLLIVANDWRGSVARVCRFLALE